MNNDKEQHNKHDQTHNPNLEIHVTKSRHEHIKIVAYGKPLGSSFPEGGHSAFANELNIFTHIQGEHSIEIDTKQNTNNITTKVLPWSAQL